MEKRFALFLVLSALILFTHLTVQNFLHPPKPADLQPAEVAEGGAPKPAAEPAKGVADGPAAKPKPPPAGPKAEQAAPAKPEAAAKKSPPAISAPPVAVPSQWVTLGSMALQSPYRLLVTLHNRGAGIERIELVQRTATGRFRFQDLEQASGYLGHLALSDEPEGKGCRVNVVGPGTPAAAAKPQSLGVPNGLRAGDVIRRIDSTTVRDTIDWDRFLAGTKPGQTVQIAVARTAAAGQPQEQLLTATLTSAPLTLVYPEIQPRSGLPAPLSFLLTLESIGDTSIPRGGEEIDKLPSLRDSNWQVRMLEDDPTGPGVEFKFILSEDDLQAIGGQGSLELIKRYRLAKTPPGELANSSFPSYHLQLEVEVLNRGQQPQQLAYRLDGSNGLPLEGWWYLSKIHPRMFAAAGARDVIWNTPATGHGLIGGSKIFADAKEALEKNQPLNIALWADPQPQPLSYVGVDTQYFATVLEPKQSETAPPMLFKQALALPVGEIDPDDKSRHKTTDVSFRLISPTHTVPAGGAWKQEFTVFAGPKQPALLTAYNLERCIEYGWFRTIAKFLGSILHVFESLPGVNYGLAIILLTVLVRSCMFPLSRKAAKNAQMMQELAPEMKRIAEKYKDDMQKRAAAQKELFAKHNYNPFGGCLLMFIQLPIFIGLYRALSVDIELRQASLIPGLPWCSNLAGPDMLWYWKPYLPAFLAGENGWLGPYLNVLPIVTIVLFLLQQKMFMPPATDEQTRMQQQMMKFMMIFMGLLFFRVPSGLCVYFIASSLWSVAERKMLPPVGPAAKPAAAGPKAPSLWNRVAAKFGSVDDSDRARAERRQRKKR
ncbi:MAG TPA: YidC/Oxa1 family insertase periplasmic-domain containing protein [Candidatus Anammoximicrobium sp.]|nr:YidC/Oxa1 family insertase periplasmic-domain containing protein [Candidatus Anammoximicrobium sp.]